jgi:transcriptional regulator with XRE-family HTH domain
MVVVPVTDTTGQVPTHELWMRLFEAPSIDRFLSDNAEACDMPTLPEYLRALCEARGMEPGQVVKQAGVERSYGNRLFSGMRHPSRDTVLQLAFGFGLSTDETQQLLKVARVAPLHPKIKRDAVIAYALHKGFSLMDVRQELYDVGLPILGGKRGV